MATADDLVRVMTDGFNGMVARQNRTNELLAELLALSKSKRDATKSMAEATLMAAVMTPQRASDDDLDSTHGNPEVKAKSPREWTGDSMTGKRFSECPPEYLELVAARLDYFAEQNAAGSEDDRKKVRFNRLDAARARGWAARMRAGWTPPAPVVSGNPFGAEGDDTIPF